MVGGALRPAERMSVGTREQLSTLYRLSLAEYLKTCVVLEQLYQRFVRGESTDPRMGERGKPVAPLADRAAALLDRLDV